MGSFVPGSRDRKTMRNAAHLTQFLRRSLLLVLMGMAFLAGAALKAQYAVGDLGSTANGNWSAAATWSTWNGAAWVPAGSAPGTTDRVFIRTGTTVLLNGSGVGYIIADLIVEPGAKLWTANFATNRYITLRGSELHCDGQIGDGANFDGISFNFDGVNTLVHGSGLFDASRLRKFSAANTVPMFSYETTVTIDMDMRLRFNSASTTQIYNNQDNTCIFNVIVAAGRTVELTGAVGSGNVAIDGIDGLSNHARGGVLTVNGTLLIPGILYARSNNVLGAPKCGIIINNGGFVRTNQVLAGASGTAIHDLVVNNGGTLEIDGSPAWQQWSLVNNTYTFANASLTIYSAAALQDVRPVPGGYGSLRLRGTGDKQLSGDTEVKGDLEILGTDGTPVLDVMAANHTLTVRGNWTNYAESGFNERTGLVIFSQGAAQFVNTAGGERFHNWRIEKTGTPYVTMASDVSIVNNLNLPAGNGRLDLNGNRLELLNPAAGAITGAFAAARHIRSERTDHTSRVQWNIGNNLGAHNIPFGSATGLRIFTFNLTAGNAGNVTVSTYGTPADNLPWPVSPTLVTNLNSTTGLLPDNRDATVDRFWQVDVSGTPTATLIFRYVVGELPLAPFNVAAAMNAQRWEPSEQKWLPATPGQSAAAYAVTAPGITSFGAFALAPTLSPLPIELVLFDAKPRNDVVDLHWATATERDNAFFTVLRSADGMHFEELLYVEAVGDSRERIDYTAVDDAPLNGLSYYRLRQTDHDGTSTESDVVPVYRAAQEPGMAVWPNPTEDLLNVAGIPHDALQLQVLDVLGRVVLSARIAPDTEREALAVRHLAPGRYTLLAERAQQPPVAIPFLKR